jgi:hypothetical protein
VTEPVVAATACRRAGPARRAAPAARPLALALLALAVGLGGCATGPSLREPGPSAGVSADDVLRQTYDRGYRRGRRDRERRLASEPGRYAEDHDAASERVFVQGYRDGYQGRYPSYESLPGAGAAVPGWVRGDFRGRDELADEEVALHVAEDGGVTLETGSEALRGAYRSGRIEVAGSRWTVRELPDGILLIPEADPRRAISLRRVP